MALRHWHIIIAPLHMVGIDADEMQQYRDTLTFVRDGKQVGQFSQYMGWVERIEEEKPREPGSVLSIVPKPPGDAA